VFRLIGASDTAPRDIVIRQIHANRSTAPAPEVIFCLGNISPHLADHGEQRFLAFDGAPLRQGLLTILREQMEEPAVVVLEADVGAHPERVLVWPVEQLFGWRVPTQSGSIRVHLVQVRCMFMYAWYADSSLSCASNCLDRGAPIDRVLVHCFKPLLSKFGASSAATHSSSFLATGYSLREFFHLTPKCLIAVVLSHDQRTRPPNYLYREHTCASEAGGEEAAKHHQVEALRPREQDCGQRISREVIERDAGWGRRIRGSWIGTVNSRFNSPRCREIPRLSFGQKLRSDPDQWPPSLVTVVPFCAWTALLSVNCVLIAIPGSSGGLGSDLAIWSCC